MFSSFFSRQIRRTTYFCKDFLILVMCGALLLQVSFALPPQQDQASQTPQTGSQNPNQQEAPPEAGGPNSDSPYAIPKKGAEAPAPPPPPKPKKVEGMPDYSIHVDVPLVTVPVMVTTKNGQFISSLKKENFRIYEDGVQQNINDFKVEQAPITAVMLIEFASTTYPILVSTLQASYIFASTLKKDDWVAAIDYDMKPEILVDFTQDKNAVMAGLNTLRMPGFSETNLFDALYDTLDRMDRVEGHKYIILISTGIDTFSKLNYDQILKKVKTTHDITIFPISIAWQWRELCEIHQNCGGFSHGVSSMGIGTIDWLQADNQMQTFAKLTGGRFYQPRFEGDMVDAFKDISGDIRNQYMIAYRPTNPKLDGTYRKLKVEVVADNGGPLKVKDQKGKDVKYEIIARDGYTARHTVD